MGNVRSGELKSLENIVDDVRHRKGINYMTPEVSDVR